MKTKASVLVLILFACITLLPASVWRISNVTGAGAHFTQINTANASSMVIAGDTLYIEPSPVIYSAATITKRLTVIGSGYFLSENPQTQANPVMTNINGFTFSTGSSGSVLMGCQFNAGIVISSSLSSIVIKRNYISISSSGTTYGIIVNPSDTDIVVAQNYITSTSNQNYSSLYVHSDAHNVLVSGNFIENVNATYPQAIVVQSTASAIFENNVFKGNLYLFNSQFNNNIWRSGTLSTMQNTTCYNNICSDNQLGTTNGNQTANMTNVFLNTGSTDGKWRLAAGSPAIGAGTGGIDCGMFAGLHPYVLSGIPSIPAIYEYFQTQNPTTQELQIDFSVKSNN